MASLLYTVDNLVDEVRSLLDEQNVDSIDTDADILPALNRAQSYAFDILARKYQEPLLRNTTLTLVSNTAEYDIPENVFEDRIQKLEIVIPSGRPPYRATYREIERVSYRDISELESATLTNVPSYYCIVGREIRLVPTPTGTYNARMWYIRNDEKLVAPQGRITVVNTGSNYVTVDSAGSSLTTEADQLGSYVNIIDGQTGEIRGTLQIQTLSNNRLVFRTSPTRSSVLNRSVTGDLSSLTLEQDDYICSAVGTCVPYYSKPVSNFLIQFSVAALTRKLGEPDDREEAVLKQFEEQVSRTWVGREQSLRIKKKSRIWGLPTRRWFFE